MAAALVLDVSFHFTFDFPKFRISMYVMTMTMISQVPVAGIALITLCWLLHSSTAKRLQPL